MDNSANESVTADSSTDDDTVNDPAAAPDKQLNKLYITILQNSARNYQKKEKKKWYKLLEKTAVATGSRMNLRDHTKIIPALPSTAQFYDRQGRRAGSRGGTTKHAFWLVGANTLL
jgi:hypothetical protein